MSYLTTLVFGLFMLENEHRKSIHDIEVELIYVVKIVEVFEPYPYIYLSGVAKLNSL